MELINFVIALSPILVVLLGILVFRQNAGASLGNLICPNNTVAACATVGQVGNESRVMKRTLPAFAVILAVYMALTLLYTYCRRSLRSGRRRRGAGRRAAAQRAGAQSLSRLLRGHPQKYGASERNLIGGPDYEDSSDKNHPSRHAAPGL